MNKTNRTKPEHEEEPRDEAAETVADEPLADQVEAATETAEPTPERSEADVLKDRLLRLQADFDNFRKRTARERAEWQAFAVEQLLLDLLPVVDHYEMGLATAAKHDADPAVLDGLKMVYEQLLTFLKRQGVTALRAEPGIPFNPHEHEAISHLPSEEHEADLVIAETRRGYKLGDKLIRPLQVVVSSGPGRATETQDGE